MSITFVITAVFTLPDDEIARAAAIVAASPLESHMVDWLEKAGIKADVSHSFDGRKARVAKTPDAPVPNGSEPPVARMQLPNN